MHELYELKEKLLRELKEYSRKEVSASSLPTIDTLAHATKNICKIIESADGEYSEDGGSYRMGGYPRRGSYRRDSRGRYASRYYNANDEMIEKLDEMMESADESVKADIMRLRQKLESR